MTQSKILNSWDLRARRETRIMLRSDNNFKNVFH